MTLGRKQLTIVSSEKSCRRAMFLLWLLGFVTRIYPQEIPQLDTFRLNNGLKVYLLSYGEGADLSLKLVINGGKKNENECQVGYSGIIQQLFAETLKENEKAVLKKEDKIICETVNGQTVFSSHCLVNDLNKNMELLSTAILKLYFSREKMDRIVASLVDRYKMENLPISDLSGIYRNLVFYGTKHPLGRSYCQYQIEKVLPEELREFYELNYIPQNSSLVICGNFNSGAVRKIITKHFIKWRSQHKQENKTEDPAPKIPAITTKEIVFVNKHDEKNCELKWILQAPSSRSSDYMAFLVAQRLFNRYLSKTLEAKTVTSDDTLHFNSLTYANDWMELNCKASQNNMRKAIQFFDTTLHHFYNLKFTLSDLQEAVTDLVNDYPENNTPKTVLSFYDPLLYHFGWRKNYISNLSLIKMKDVQPVIQKYFKPGFYKLVVVGTEHRVTDQLNSLGNVTRYSTSDFETCDEACRDVVISRCHCESCWRRGQYKVWQFNPKEKEAIKRSKAKSRG